jgi:glycosyltransferase involved in cell wall biosynthesis
LVSDGGSTDQTLDICKKYGDKVLVINSKPGFSTQIKAGINYINSNLFFAAESDQIYPHNFARDLLSEFDQNEYYGIQGTLRYLYTSNIIETTSNFMLSVDKKSGPSTIISSPCIYKTSYFINIVSNLPSCSNYSIDTIKTKVERDFGYKVYTGNTTAYQVKSLSFTTFLNKYWLYGAGDAYYIKLYFKNPLNKEFYKSLLYPIFKIHQYSARLSPKNLRYLPIIVLAMVVRQLSLVLNLIRNLI